MEYITLNYEDLENLNFLAEDVLHELRFNYYFYNDDGDCIKYDNSENKDILLEKNIQLLNDEKHYLEFRNNKELKKISFAEAVKISHKELIDKYLGRYLAKARGIMRKGSFPLTLMKVSNDISDEYLNNLFALRFKENLKLWTKYWEIERNENGKVD